MLNWASKQKQKLIDYKTTFGSEHGQKVLKDLIKSCHMTDHCIGKNNEQTYVMLGERNVILRILKILETTPEKLEQLIKEQSEE